MNYIFLCSGPIYTIYTQKANERWFLATIFFILFFCCLIFVLLIFSFVLYMSAKWVVEKKSCFSIVILVALCSGTSYIFEWMKYELNKPIILDFIININQIQISYSYKIRMIERKRIELVIRQSSCIELCVLWMSVISLAFC